MTINFTIICILWFALYEEFHQLPDTAIIKNGKKNTLINLQQIAKNR